MEPSVEFIEILSGLVIGVVLGVTVHRSNYCMMGGVADLVLTGSTIRLRAWLLTIAVAIIGVQILTLTGSLDLSTTVYLSPRVSWAGAIVGGLMFGFGMVIACGCGSRSLVNMGTGDLKALITVTFLGLSASMTLHGLTAIPRSFLERQTIVDLSNAGFGGQGIVELMAAATGFSDLTLRLIFGLGLPALILFYCFRNVEFRQEKRFWVAGTIIAFLVVISWLMTTALAADDFSITRLSSLSFVTPVGNGMQYLVAFTGTSADFAMATVGGVVLGGLISSLANDKFRWVAFEDVFDLARYIGGGILMGVGGVTALGCTIGQGVSGISTLGLTSIIATLAIFIGAVIGVRYLDQGSLISALRMRLPNKV